VQTPRCLGPCGSMTTLLAGTEYAYGIAPCPAAMREGSVALIEIDPCPRHRASCDPAIMAWANAVIENPPSHIVVANRRPGMLEDIAVATSRARKAIRIIVD